MTGGPMHCTSEKMERHYHPERFPNTWWHLHPIWTQLVKERGFDWIYQRWANTTDLMRPQDVK